MTVEPMEHTGNTQNVDYYRERGAKPNKPYVWAQVLYSGIQRVNGEIVRRSPPVYYVRVTRNMHGEIADFKYEPRTNRGVLSARAVTRLVREALA